MKMSGIYQIRNIVNGKCYIGSAVNFNTRWQRHKRDLRRGVHHSVLLQRSWDKYSEEKFVFEILENTKNSVKQLILSEQRHLDTYKPEYNICKTAGQCSEKTKLKIGKANTGHKHTAEAKEKMSIAKRGKRNWRASLSTENVREIRQLRQNGKTYSEIGKKYEVGLFVIRDVIKKITYKYVI